MVSVVPTNDIVFRCLKHDVVTHHRSNVTQVIGKSREARQCLHDFSSTAVFCRNDKCQLLLWSTSVAIRKYSLENQIYTRKGGSEITKLALKSTLEPPTPLEVELYLTPELLYSNYRNALLERTREPDILFDLQNSCLHRLTTQASGLVATWKGLYTVYLKYTTLFINSWSLYHT